MANAEVENTNLARRGEKDVLGFDVPVNDLLRVRRGESLENRMRNEHDLGDGQPAVLAALRARPHGLSDEQGHYEENAAVVSDVVVDDRDDAWVADAVRELRLAAESSFDLWVRREPLVKNLDGDGVPVPVRAGWQCRLAPMPPIPTSRSIV